VPVLPEVGTKQQFLHGMDQRFMGRVDNGTSGDKYHVIPRPDVIQASTDDLPQTAFDPVAYNRTADASADRKAKTAVWEMIGQHT